MEAALSPFELFCALRVASDERAALHAFLSAIDGQIVSLTLGFTDPDEAAQRTRLEIRRKWRTCRADSPERLGAWIRRVARSQGVRSLRFSHRPLPPLAVPEVEPTALAGPEEDVSEKSLGEALERSFEAALGIEPATLPARHRAWARAHDVAFKGEIARRDVEIALQSRLDGVPLADLAEQRGMTLAAVKKASCRGAAVIALSARLLAEEEPDPLLRESLLAISERIGVYASRADGKVAPVIRKASKTP